MVSLRTLQRRLAMLLLFASHLKNSIKRHLLPNFFFFHTVPISTPCRLSAKSSPPAKYSSSPASLASSHNFSSSSSPSPPIAQILSLNLLCLSRSSSMRCSICLLSNLCAPFLTFRLPEVPFNVEERDGCEGATSRVLSTVSSSVTVAGSRTSFARSACRT